MTTTPSTEGVQTNVHRTAKIVGAILAVLVVGLILFAVGMHYGFKGLARTDCGHNLVQIGLWCREYAAAHGGRFPSTWDELNLVDGANWARLLRCPSTGHQVGDWRRVDLWADYRLIPGRTTNDPPDTILAIEPLANHSGAGANVLFVDGSQQWWSASHVIGTNLDNR